MIKMGIILVLVMIIMLIWNNKNTTIINNSKKPEKFENKQNCEKCMFSHNPIYPLLREGHSPYLLGTLITTIPGTSLLSSN